PARLAPAAAQPAVALAAAAPGVRRPVAAAAALAGRVPVAPGLAATETLGGVGSHARGPVVPGAAPVARPVRWVDLPAPEARHSPDRTAGRAAHALQFCAARGATRFRLAH